MEPNQTRRPEPDQQRKNRQPDTRRAHAAFERTEELDGQLGPDELPDATEVAMNLEAKRHH